MKDITFTIPCYNSQDYMERCIDSLLPGGEDVEILVVDDGSKDMTPEIADAYEKRYPNIVKAIHQQAPAPAKGIRFTDKKLRQKIREKKMAQGHKADDHEPEMTL